MNPKLVVALVLMGMGANAVAQTACPNGVAPGSPQCGPSPAAHLPNPVIPKEPMVRYVPTGKWKKTWGAIAIDSSVGDIGASSGMFSEREAKRDAMERCEKHGGTECKLQISYENQCAVVAWPTVAGDGVLAQTGPSIEVASTLAADKCSELSGDKCNIVYSECTKPVFEAF